MMSKNRQRTAWVRAGCLGMLGWVLILGIPVLAVGPFQEADIVILHEFHGETIGDGFGWVGAALGDLDGDGSPDFATTAPFYGGASANGKIYVYSGQSGTLLHEAVGVEGNRLGYSISSTGDVNNDGTPDYIVGSRPRPTASWSTPALIAPFCTT
ncbi:MAG: integrin alpha [Caldilineaceae bacterium]